MKNLDLAHLPTPSALIDVARMDQNIKQMQQHINQLGVRFRPHVKTSKCSAVVERQLAAGACGITVSTLKEAEQFFALGQTDILYAVGIAPNKLEPAMRLRQSGCNLKVITDGVEAAAAIVEFGKANRHRFEVWIEIDTDGHRSGVKPEDPKLITIGRQLHDGDMQLGGVITHAGASYSLSTPAALRVMAEQERALCVRAAERLRDNGLPCPNVSVGSTPTALSAQQMHGVTEVRAGVYVFFDMVMVNVGVCAPANVALSVLTSVIGHQVEKGWIIVDAGWMAMSRDRGTSAQAVDYGYGQVCDAQGQVLPGFVMSGANQEHGIVSRVGDITTDIGTDIATDIATQFPLGSLLRILPNHACATAAQFPEYWALNTPPIVGERQENRAPIVETWPRFSGW